MTRVNYGIKPIHLPDKLLLAEHREIKRIPKIFEKSLKSGSINRIPKKFTLGKGHVLFFIDKPFYTYSRYIEIYNECINRGFNVENYSNNWYVYKRLKFNGTRIRITQQDLDLITDRLISRIITYKEPILRYYGKPYSKLEFINLLSDKYGKDITKIL